VYFSNERGFSVKSSLLGIFMCCSVLQCVAEPHGLLIVWCDTRIELAGCCSVLQFVAASHGR